MQAQTTDSPLVAQESVPSLDNQHFSSGAGIIAAYRERFQEVRPRLGGRHGLSPQCLARIEEFISRRTPQLLTVHTELPMAAGQLLIRFEETARRLRVPFPSADRVRLAAYESLLAELAANVSLLQMKPKDVIGATLAQSKLVGEIPRERSLMRAPITMAIVRHAVKNYPATSRAFLEEVHQTVERVLLNKRIAEGFAGHMSDVVHQAVHNPKETESALLAVLDRELALRRNRRFKLFHDFAPWVFRDVALGYPTRAHQFLADALKSFRSLRRDPQFKKLKGCDYVFLSVVINYPTKRERRLKSIVEALGTLEADGHRSGNLPRWVLVRAALESPEQPRRALGHLLRREAAIFESDALSELRPFRAQIRWALMMLGRKAPEVLSRANFNFRILREEPEFRACSPRLLVEACIRYPHDPRAAIRDRRIS